MDGLWRPGIDLAEYLINAGGDLGCLAMDAGNSVVNVA